MNKKLYFGGPILTMDKTCPTAEAILTENGRIIGRGRLSEFDTVQAEKIDLAGRTMLPAFVDGHSHMMEMGEYITSVCDLTGCTSFGEILDRIRRFRDEKQLFHGEPIQARGYDLGFLEEGTHPTGRLLDSLGFDNPISCMHVSGHMASYNRVAMERVGVYDDTYMDPPGGSAGRDADGLNGYFEENAIDRFYPIFTSETTREAMKSYVLTAQDAYVKHGFATIQDGSLNLKDPILAFRSLAEEGKLKADCIVYMDSNPASAPLWEEMLATMGRDYFNHMKLAGTKMFLDGSPHVKTAWFSEPYVGEGDYCGYPTLTAEDVEARLECALKYNLQPLAHCNGDAASERFLASWEKVTAGKPIPDLRPVMIHAQTVRYDQLDRMIKVGMMPSFFSGHCYFWADIHLVNLGDRGMRISPLQQALNRGHICSLHQDCPVTPPDMLHTVWCAVNRITRKGVKLDESNCVTPYDALIAATHGGAYSYHEENTKGILKAGALADFVILDQDPTAVDPMTIKDIKVLRTIKEDEVLYSAE